MTEPGSTKDYAVDRRWRENGVAKTYKVPANLYVAEATVWRIVDRFQRTGDVCASLATPR